MTEIIMEVYDAFKAGGIPEEEARKAAQSLTERVVRAEANSDANIASVAAFRSSTNEKIDVLRRDMNDRFADMQKQMDNRFDHMQRQMDNRFEQVDKRFEQVDKRFEQVDKRFEQIDSRFKHVDDRFDQMQTAIMSLQSNQKLMMWMLGLIIITVVVPILTEWFK